jgi:hypothetical protein
MWREEGAGCYLADICIRVSHHLLEKSRLFTLYYFLHIALQEIPHDSFLKNSL